MKKYILTTISISMLAVILKADNTAILNLLPLMFKPETGYMEYELPNPCPVVPVTVTAYSPTEEECDSDPNITAYQKPVKEGTIAISRDLEEEFGWSLGDKVHLKGIGVFEVWDRMNPRWKKKVDIFFHDTEKAVSFGVKQARVLKVEKREKKGV